MTDPFASDPVLRTDLPGLLARGKVREIYELGPQQVMLVASDRISAFDVVMDQPIPGKGVLLTRISAFWLERLPQCSPHHLDYVVSAERCPERYCAHAAQLAGRAMVCRRVEVLPVECVVRGYVVGGGWKEYQAGGRISGIELPPGLRLAERLPEPIFTPSTKATSGHDEPIAFEQACELAGGDRMRAARRRALEIYQAAAVHAERRGVILADTKFEFGMDGTELVLADEVLTPDSSRYWPAESWRPGANPPSFDKQFLRDYLETLDWPKTPPPPELPAEIIAQTRARYERAWRLLCG